MESKLVRQNFVFNLLKLICYNDIVSLYYYIFMVIIFRVIVCIDDLNGSDVIIYYKLDVYIEVVNCFFGFCLMRDCDIWLDEIFLIFDQVFVFDVYVVRNGLLWMLVEVEIDFIYVFLFSIKNKIIKVIVKQDGEWKEVEIVNEVYFKLFEIKNILIKFGYFCIF